MISQQYSCAKCLTDVDDEDVIWADVYGNLTTMSGYPYCQGCTPEELNYQYYRNVILNSAYMFKTKGTRKSLEYIMRFIGAPDALLEFNEVIYLADTKINTNKLPFYIKKNLKKYRSLISN